MASSGSSGGSNGAAGSSGAAGKSRMQRLFRQEGMVSEAELRVDVAQTVARVVAGDATVDLDEASIHARGDLLMSRRSRIRNVTTYVSRVEERHNNMIGMAVEEHVQGGVDYRMQKDSDTILGGTYVNTIAGPWVRLCAWGDFLAWGGWLEVDTIRIEIAGIMIRAYMFYAHAVGARVTAAAQLVDDFLIRNETFGTLMDLQGSAIHLGTPGSSMEMST